MNFVSAFSETIGKETAAPAAPTTPVVPEASGNSFTSDDMRSYVDAKFEALKSDLLHEMQSLRQVETPKETNNTNMGTNNSEENNKKEELKNAISSDLPND